MAPTRAKFRCALTACSELKVHFGYGKGGASSRALWQVLVLVVAADDGLLRERQDERSRMVMSTFTSLADRAGGQGPSKTR